MHGPARHDPACHHYSRSTPPARRAYSVQHQHELHHKASTQPEWSCGGGPWSGRGPSEARPDHQHNATLLTTPLSLTAPLWDEAHGRWRNSAGRVVQGHVTLVEPTHRETWPRTRRLPVRARPRHEGVHCYATTTAAPIRTVPELGCVGVVQRRVVAWPECACLSLWHALSRIAGVVASWNSRVVPCLASQGVHDQDQGEPPLVARRGHARIPEPWPWANREKTVSLTRFCCL